VEILVTTAIAAVLAGIGIPSMASMIHSVKLSSAANSFVSGLYVARSEAIKRNGRVVICKSEDGATCSSGGGWQQGWLVFHDANNNGVRDGGESIILREMGLATGLRLTGNMNVAKYVSFAPNGATKLVGGGFQAGTLIVCHASASAGEGREIILNAVGRARVQKVEVTGCA